MEAKTKNKNSKTSTRLWESDTLFRVKETQQGDGSKRWYRLKGENLICWSRRWGNVGCIETIVGKNGVAAGLITKSKGRACRNWNGGRGVGRVLGTRSLKSGASALPGKKHEEKNNGNIKGSLTRRSSIKI